MEKYCAIICACLLMCFVQLGHGLKNLEGNIHTSTDEESPVSINNLWPASPQDAYNGLQDMPFENVVKLDDNESEMNIINTDPLVEEIPYDIQRLLELNRKRGVPERGFTNETKMKILDLHNLYRSNVTPPSGNMAFMEWDATLEHLAQLWADGCVFAHGKPRNTSYPLGPYGQNLYLGTDPSGYKGLWLWYEEYLHYDMRKQHCKPNEQCGHYVQMAWGESMRLGCGITKCGLRYLMVCHYYPPAMKGQQMYIVARPCSQCSNEDGALCRKNLCMSWEQCERNPKLCETAKCNLKCQNCGRLNKTTCQCTCADGWDSPDCSRLCEDEHERCGVNPGFPSKASCSMNRNAVAKKYCRKMCQSCNPFIQDIKFNDVCCEGILCENGYVLDLYRKPCRCTLLCPGPNCDILEDGGYVVESCLLLTIMQVLIFYFITVFHTNVL